ncbi:MAG: VLRF1 family aeRF1-type release factor [Bacillota bacterium]
MLNRRDADALVLLDRGDILSLYLNVDPAQPENQSAPPAYRIWVKNALDEVTEGADREQRRVLREVATRVREYVNLYRPRGKGLALFAGPDFWREFTLPVPVLNHVHFGQPDVAPLLWLLDEYKPYGIVLVDRVQARFLAAFLGRAAFQGESRLVLDTTDWRRMDLKPATGHGIYVKGSNRDAFDARVDEQIASFWRSVAEQVTSWAEQEGFRQLVIGGEEEAVAEVLRLLPEETARLVAGKVNMFASASESEVLERVEPVVLAFERQRELSLVDRVLDGALSGGQAAIGLADVLGVLQEGRAHVVVVAWPFEGTAYQCFDCGYLLVQRQPHCPFCSGALTVRPLRELLPRLAYEKKTGLELVSEAAAERLAVCDGIAALLRY